MPKRLLFLPLMSRRTYPKQTENYADIKARNQVRNSVFSTDMIKIVDGVAGLSESIIIRL